MIIIDEYADSKLVKALETIKSRGELARCAHFRFSGMQSETIGEDPRQRVISAARSIFFSLGAAVYLCEDGDVFVLVSALYGRHARRMISEVAEALQEHGIQTFADYFELPQSVHILLARLEEKSEKCRKTSEAIRKKNEQDQTEQKRRLILHDYLLKNNLRDIAFRRREREHSEIMIIEDDMFSRKLVESVLNGQYSLTALNDAEHALATYISRAPDVLFLDINLPNVTGHELLEKIIAMDPEAYIVMFSGNSDRRNIDLSLSLGAKGFIAKPFTGNKLFQYINHCPTIRKGNFYVH